MTERLMAIPFDELRRQRAELQRQDDVISYVRRIAQARLDLLDAEMERRRGSGPGDPEALTTILASHLTAEGSPRPPRPAGESSDHPLAVELEELCARLGAADLTSLDDTEIDQLRIALLSFERARSQERRELYDELDALSAELVRRYREGEAHIDRLLDSE